MPDSSANAPFLSSTRRRFVKYSTLLGVGAQTLLATGSPRSAYAEGKEAAGMGAPWPEMQYRTLGRTGLRVGPLGLGSSYGLSEAGVGRRINTVMQTCFFSLAGILPQEEAVRLIKQAIE